jgi:hypothetical protein
MRAYLATTGALFACVTILHVLRLPEIADAYSQEPGYALGYGLLTLVSAALSVWAWMLFFRTRRAPVT